MFRRLSQAVTRNPQVRQCATNQATSGATSEATATATAERIQLKPIRQAHPTDGSVVYRKGIPIRGKLSKLPLKEKLIMCLVFSITGSSAVYVVRPTLQYCKDHGFLGLPEDASWRNGPWWYPLLYFSIMWPTYTILLFTFGGLFGRRIWFSNMIVKMWGRLLPKRGKAYLEYMLDVQ